jgi:hypothetical protein
MIGVDAKFRLTPVLWCAVEPPRPNPGFSAGRQNGWVTTQVDGSWRLLVDSPMGQQDFSVDLNESDGELIGVLRNNSNGMTSDIFDGRVDDGTLRWKAKLKAIRMTVSFTASVEGDTMSGSVKAGVFGTYPLTGKRD